MKVKFTIFLSLLLISNIIYGQEEYAEIGYVIIYSGKNYEASLIVAKEASEKLDYKIDLREQQEIPRGRFNNGNYISIEASSDYEGFSKGYYIVIISSKHKDDESLKPDLLFAKKFYKDAYIKTSKVYLGCMH